MKLAIIPARGGSKRLPGKNIKMLAGKPLIHWSITAALQSGVFDHVCVSTDCQAIADCALDAGAEVPFMRPAELATDTATTASVVAWFIQQFEAYRGCPVEQVCLLQPTSPLRKADDILQAHRMLVDEQLDAVVSVCEMEHPYQLCNTLDASGSLKGFIDQHSNVRSQEQPIYYRLNGAIYYCQRALAMNFGCLYDESVNSRAYIMTQADSVDIDTQLDFIIAEALINHAHALQQ